MRAPWAVASLLLASPLIASLGLAGCDTPQVVDCGSGRFTRLDGEGWCVYPTASGVTCPVALPAEHRLPFGGTGCAATLHDPAPEELCAVYDRCPSDAGR
ncbi:MAG: hypothetical protein IT378_18490 [Sandaracinaceae bacterium]|nr:hypothetical protein [Sandaracinaceae bacterium]